MVFLCFFGVLCAFYSCFTGVSTVSPVFEATARWPTAPRMAWGSTRGCRGICGSPKTSVTPRTGGNGQRGSGGARALQSDSFD